MLVIALAMMAFMVIMLAIVSAFGQSMAFWRRTDDGDNFDDVQLEG